MKPSPCKKCEQDTKQCSRPCGAFLQWFSECWERVRAYGKNRIKD